MKIYSLNTTDFSNNGYGFLTDVISADVKEEINGEYTLTMEYLLNGHLAEYLERENIIVCKVADGTEQPFRIKYIERNFKTINVIAYHISYDLGDDLVINTAPTNLTAQAFGRWVLNNSTTHAQLYTFNSDITATASARYIRKNVLECFMSDDDNSMLNKFKGEFKRDNYTITYNTRIGQDTGVKLLVGKNINEINITIDDTGLFTRIVPVGYDGLTIPEIYVDSILINNYPFPKGCIAKFEDIKYDETGEDPDAYHDINDFYDALRAAANQMFTDGVDKPLINVDIDWLDLAKTKEYENYTSLETIRLGDTLTCDMGDFQYTTRVIATTYNVLLDRITNFEIGKPKASYATQANATIQELSEVDTSNLLEQAQINASNLLKDAMTGYIYFDYDNGNLYIMDNPDPDDAVKVWRWNLNGLGYSNTGINGTYGLAITMDGSIVADYITTGTLNTAVIQGYDSLVQSVEQIINLITDDSGTGSVQLQNAAEGLLHRLELNGTFSLVYPNDSSKYGYSLMISDNLIVSNDIYISSGVPYQNDTLYPESTLYPRDTYLQVDNTLYKLDFDYLNYMSESVYDKWIYDEGKQWIERYVGIDSNGDMYALDTPVIEIKPDINIEVKANSILTLKSFPSATLKVSYMIQNEYSDAFATKAYVGSRITQTKNEIDLEVQQKVSDDEIIAKLNLAVEDGQGIIDIKGNQVKITSDYFTLDETGHIDATSGEIGGFNMTDKNFNNNISGLYDFNQYDCNMIKQYILNHLTTNATALELYDLNSSGTLQVGDYSKMKAIINGTETNTHTVNGKFTINSDNPKNCVQILDENNEQMVSLGIGGINTNLLTARGLVIQNPNEYSASSSDNHFVSIDETGKVNIQSRNDSKPEDTFIVNNLVPIYTGPQLSSTSPAWIKRMDMVPISGSEYIEVTTGNDSWGITVWHSDKRLKDNIKDSKENALEKVMKIKHRQFTYKNDENKKIIKNGYIADELEEIDKDFIFEVGKDKIKSPNTKYIIPLLSKAIQEQQEQIEELKKEIELLKEEKNGKDKLSK